MKTVYLDHAATTPTRQEVYCTLSSLQESYGNPSSGHEMGLRSRELIHNARKMIADKVGAKPHEIIFCSGATEANNQAIIGFCEANKYKGNHIITTQIEHKSVINTCKYLESLDFEVTYLPVDKYGMVDMGVIEDNVRNDTILASIIYANNEIGTIQNVKSIGKICKRFGICFHTDAVQAFGHCDIDVKDLNISLMSLSGHKIGASKGIGALYVYEHTPIHPLLHGGGQEFNMRAGTQNLEGTIGMGRATELIENDKDYKELKDILKRELANKIPSISINGHEKGLGNILSVTFHGLPDSINIVEKLSEMGVYVSGGAACLSSDKKPSHVLTAIGYTPQLASKTARFSFGNCTTVDDVMAAAKAVTKIFERI